MNRNPDTLPIRESTKSLQRFKTLPIQERVHMVSNELLNNYKQPSRAKISRPSTNKPKRTQEEMANRIKVLESELERKISQDGILRNFLKTLNNSDLSRIDIYLELRKCEEIIEPLQARLAQQGEKGQSYLHRIQTLESLLEEKQTKYIENIVVLESQFDENYKNRENELSNFKSKLEDMKNELEDNQFLLAEVKKKNESLMQDNKALAQQHKSIDKKYQKALKQLESTKSEMLNKIWELQSRSECIQLEYEQLKMKNAVLVAKVDKHERNRSESNEEIMKLHDECQQKDRENSRYRQILDRNQFKIAELQREVGKRQQSIATLSDKLSACMERHAKQIHILECQCRQMSIANQQLCGQIKQLEKERMSSEQSTRSDRSMIRQLKERQQALIKYYENEREQMVAELKRQKFHDIQNESLRRRYQQEQEEKEGTIQKLQNKLGDLIKENHFLSKRVDEMQKELDKCKTNQKFNQKIYVENYKIAGRLLEIKKQIIVLLNTQVEEEHEEQAQASLEKVTSSFIKTVYSLIIQCKSSNEKTQAMRKNQAQRIKQLCNLVHHFQNAVDIDNVDQLVQRYIGYLEPLVQFDTKNSEAISEAYHLLIQKLINGQKSKKFITQPSINTVNDSLDNVIFKENPKQSNDKQLFDKKYEQSIRQSTNSHTLSRSKESQSNKENINSINQGYRISRQKNSAYYNSIDRPNVITQGNRRSSDRIRTEIERKYFRS